jgi:VWFA-related protein
MKHLMPQHLRLQNVVIFLFALVVLPLANFRAFSQIQLDLTIDEIVDEDFPYVKAFVSLTDGQGYPVTGLQLDNFSILESGKVPSDMEVTPVYQKPIAIALVIDVSRSMGYGPAPHSLDLIIQAANEFVDTLAPEDMVAVIAFSDDVTVVEKPTSDKSKVKAALNSLAPLENAALNDAILDSVVQIKNFSGQKVILLFTDGPESGLSEYTFDQVLDEAVRQKVHVYSSGWRSSNQMELEKLAHLTNGSFYKLPGDLPDLAAFKMVFNTVQNNLPALREQYMIKFTSSVTADRGEHTFVVKAVHLGGSAEDIGRFVAHSADVTVSLPELVDGQVIGGKVRFAPQVQAASPLAEMDLTIDGQVLASRITQPFEYILDSANVAPGEHTFTLVVRDTAGNAGEHSISLKIEPPLTIQITSPMNGASLSEETLISAEVRGFSPITRVEFELDGSLIETVNVSPYEMLWNPATAPAGSHKVRAKVYDTSGYEATHEINVNVALKEQSGMLWIVALATLATAGIIVPLAFRSRRRRARYQPEAIDPGIPSVAQSADAISKAYLSEIEGNSPGERWPLSSTETRLGRKRDENDIPLKGLGASRRHALIKLEDGKHILVSLNPENPILINDQPAMQQVLNNGDIIRAGDTSFIYEQL